MRFFDICICCAGCLEWHVTFSPATKSIEIVNVHVRSCSCSRSLFPHISFAIARIHILIYVCWFVLPLYGDSAWPWPTSPTNATASPSHPQCPPPPLPPVAIVVSRSRFSIISSHPSGYTCSSTISCDPRPIKSIRIIFCYWLTQLGSAPQQFSLGIYVRYAK